MKIKDHLFTAFQGFLFGAIVMGFVADYNTNQLPIALIFLVLSVVSRLASDTI